MLAYIGRIHNLKDLKVGGSDFMFHGSGFRVEGWGFRVQGSRFRFQRNGLSREYDSGFRLWAWFGFGLSSR